ncbi:hypothetical protein BDZ90DRAFT_233630 [Jaminaea rosea]|uniref:Matrin-type domain-containing protein n=1 Tax=Jaminaea rosea TaxID=1569628 RepID=A0A316UM55_9BASI|nr:hypothetical protein BDZ90DRAFT_233630 [Jaminaea rosea]PWN26034.1 hypothetical protein BDZ90DRAFT_233630 [Jaminaea rosea]
MSLASPFEVARSTHEEAERYEAALASILNTLPSSSTAPPTRQSIKNAHLASLLADRIVSRNDTLRGFYADETGVKKEELTALASGVQNAEASSSSSSSMESSMSLFYSRLNHIRQYHEKYPAAPPETLNLDLPAMEGLIAPSQSGAAAGFTTDAIDRLFSGEEGAGRYIDVYEHHSRYINLKGVRRVNYLTYLDKMHVLAEIEVDVKRQDGYRSYLAGLRSYLVEFLRKIRPLDDVDGMVADAEGVFAAKWDQGEAEGWSDQGNAFATSSDQPQASSSSGPRPPNAGAAEDGGVWCDACQKSFAKQTVFDGHLSGKKHKQAVARRQGTNGSAANGNKGSQEGKKAAAARDALLAKAKQLARDEAVIVALAEGPLATHRADTRSNVERRAALTERERQAEAEEMARLAEGGGDAEERGGGAEGVDGEGSDDDGDDKIYNPKKLPLGWDGRPIPVWLYKLHGLGVEYKCEICSDFVYQGRKNFDRHFQESRHAFGMRALGLPNTRHFWGVTKIEDAVELAEKLKKQGKEGGEAAQGPSAVGGARDVEEVEDESGNTYSRKDYELLKRQGLI